MVFFAYRHEHITDKFIKNMPHCADLASVHF